MYAVGPVLINYTGQYSISCRSARTSVAEIRRCGTLSQDSRNSTIGGCGWYVDEYACIVIMIFVAMVASNRANAKRNDDHLGRGELWSACLNDYYSPGCSDRAVVSCGPE